VTDGQVEVALLGPVAVTGAAGIFRRPAALELAVYLTFHRRRVGHAEWSLALWPDRAVAPSTVHSTASDCRRALGRARDGVPHLPRGSTLQLRDTVTTDVERFASLATPGDPVGVLAAMRLVRGPLFAGLHRVDWAVLDGTQAGVESMVAQAALGAADRLMRSPDGAAAAAWIVRRALLLCPYDERLYRMLLRGLDAQGNRAGLHAAMDELCTLAGEAPRPRPRAGAARRPVGHANCLHPETVALYEHLVGGQPAAGGHPARL